LVVTCADTPLRILIIDWLLLTTPLHFIFHNTWLKHMIGMWSQSKTCVLECCICSHYSIRDKCRNIWNMCWSCALLTLYYKYRFTKSTLYCCCHSTNSIGHICIVREWFNYRCFENICLDTILLHCLDIPWLSQRHIWRRQKYQIYTYHIHAVLDAESPTTQSKRLFARTSNFWIVYLIDMTSFRVVILYKTL
jgi:hypothetical protein